MNYFFEVFAGEQQVVMNWLLADFAEPNLILWRLFDQVSNKRVVV
jgi:hypothetical protein